MSKSFSCQKCLKIFPYKKNLDYHTKNVTCIVLKQETPIEDMVELKNENILLKLQIEHLKDLIKSKDDVIDALKRMPVQTIQMISEIPNKIPEVIIEKPSAFDYKNEYKDAMCFDKLIDYCSDPEFNSSIIFFVDENNNNEIQVDDKNENITVLKNIETNFYPKIKEGKTDKVNKINDNQTFNYYIKGINAMISKLKAKKEILPIFCSNKRKQTLNIKTSEGWIEMTDDKIYKLFSYFCGSFMKSCVNSQKYIKKLYTSYKLFSASAWTNYKQMDLLSSLSYVIDDKDFIIKKMKTFLTTVCTNSNNATYKFETISESSDDDSSVEEEAEDY